uniref:AlNc14C27G2661 protein n=1 Tax=Albugo laibachii Nc14 TaxID=890382 RepID=F0W732_9STRA|nr:AlNc14C27G2661 [Albugo laibachii Nc14]|eukprot:CCA16931.1 AlNc14C27G2661 [Albugo laibachii Nc14]
MRSQTMHFYIGVIKLFLGLSDISVQMYGIDSMASLGTGNEWFFHVSYSGSDITHRFLHERIRVGMFCRSTATSQSSDIERVTCAENTQITHPKRASIGVPIQTRKSGSRLAIDRPIPFEEVVKGKGNSCI